MSDIEYATLDPVTISDSTMHLITEDCLTVDYPGFSNTHRQGIRSTIGITEGLWAFEVTDRGAASGYSYWNGMALSLMFDSHGYGYNSDQYYIFRFSQDAGLFDCTGKAPGTFLWDTWSGGVATVLIDLTMRKLWISVSDYWVSGVGNFPVWLGDGDPASGVRPTCDFGGFWDGRTPIYPAVVSDAWGSGFWADVNFGQKPFLRPIPTKYNRGIYRASLADTVIFNHAGGRKRVLWPELPKPKEPKPERNETAYLHNLYTKLVRQIKSNGGIAGCPPVMSIPTQGMRTKAFDVLGIQGRYFQAVGEMLRMKYQPEYIETDGPYGA